MHDQVRTVANCVGMTCPEVDRATAQLLADLRKTGKDPWKVEKKK
jgi:hypothetical protein